MITVTRTESQASRHGDRRHAASIARQRQNSPALQPRQTAELIASVIRKRIADGQPLPAMKDVSEDVWIELLDILTAAEIGEINIAAAGEVEVEPEPERSWREREPRHVRSLKWRDSSGIERLHVVRGNSLDEVLREDQEIEKRIIASRELAKARM